MARKTKSRNKESRLRSTYRFSIFNDTSHKEMFSFKAKGLIMMLGLSLAIILIIVSVTFLISFTPLREYIPGYPNAESRKAIIQNAIKADSLEQALKMWTFQLENIHRIVKGETPVNIDTLTAAKNDTSGANPTLATKISKEDSIMRVEVMKQEMSGANTQKTIMQIEGLHFFPPVKGVISAEYNPAAGHPYTDIAAPVNSVVSAVLDGTVIMADWTDESGFTIQIQHSNDLISIYKNNSKLLKKPGERVKAGTAIALVGDNKANSDGNHLHFELWHKGAPVDPVKYIKF
jgi:murein DD-endopeptidase MepM/ murein hydrolase activator NlpD